MDFENVWGQAQVLFKNFGWYSIALVAGTFVIMLGLNLLFKRIMKTENLSRLRKTISAISVYVVAMGLVALFTAVVLKQPLTFAYVIGASIPCALLAQALWTLYKFARDYGIEPLIAKIKESGVAEKELVKLGINKKIVKVILASLEDYLKDKKVENLDGYLKEEYVISLKIADYIKGFVTPDKSSEAMKLIKEKIKAEYEA